MADGKATYWNAMVPELTVANFPASLDFYVEILGFTLMIRRHEPEFAYLCFGKAQLMLEQHHPQGWNTADLEYPLGRGVNFQIEVDDVEPILARLQACDVPLYRALRDSHYHTGETEACQREFLVQDPDGYLLRFSQYIE
ncbi:bleomycin resistance protein [Pantoea sp. FN060301]|uniref:bleomycin resistance protein n=1 Tax=Pantoea sp. FN060301 TaxID=3420380 RepID=UPI003D1662E9